MAHSEDGNILSRIFTTLEPKKLKTLAEMTEADLRKEVLAHGLNLQWEMAAECPCERRMSLTGGGTTVTEETGEARPDCPRCGGSRWYYHSKQPVKGVILASEKQPERFAHYGRMGIGSVRITTLGEHLPGFMDRFTVTDRAVVFSETRDRTAATTEALRYPITPRSMVLGVDGDETTAQAVEWGVLNIIRTDADGVALPGDLVDGVDYDVVGGKIDWSKGEDTVTAAGPRIVFDAAARTIVRDAGDWVADGWLAGDAITASGAQTPANNGTYYIDTVTALMLTLRVGDLVTDDGGDDVVSFAGGRAPVLGAKYGVHYYTEPVYRVHTFPYANRDTYVRDGSSRIYQTLPVLADCSLEWLGSADPKAGDV